MDIKMIFRKTTNYNADLIVEDFNGNQKKVAVMYATFSTGESVSKTMIIEDQDLYERTKDQVDGLVEVFNAEVEALAKFHNVPIV